MPDVLTEKKTLPSACPLDCPDACCLDVTVEDGRVTQIEGARRHPLTAGFLCSKVGRYHRHVYAPERLRYPMVRDGERGSGAFRRVSWDEAFERVAGRLREVRDEHGGEAILPFCYGGSNGALGDPLRIRLRFGGAPPEGFTAACPASSHGISSRLAWSSSGDRIPRCRASTSCL